LRLGSDPRPGNPMCQGTAKKSEKKKKEKKRREKKKGVPVVAQQK